mmetsp:Transcript_17076/g.64652  ORF Transcript_17076/g.64652 Transcript_17076/m.64652 type:complete len:207 (+) Transcript_17076:1707-2327(+)
MPSGSGLRCRGGGARLQLRPAAADHAPVAGRQRIELRRQRRCVEHCRVWTRRFDQVAARGGGGIPKRLRLDAVACVHRGVAACRGLHSMGVGGIVGAVHGAAESVLASAAVVAPRLIAAALGAAAGQLAPRGGAIVARAACADVDLRVAGARGGPGAGPVLRRPRRVLGSGRGGGRCERRHGRVRDAVGESARVSARRGDAGWNGQ